MIHAETYEAFIAYFDVLGYKAFFEDKENDISAFLENSLSLVEDTRNIAKQSETSLLIQYKLFSDNCILVIRFDDSSYQKAFRLLVDKVAYLQMKFLKDYRIPIRGAITKGQIFVNNDIVFGSGLITAEKLERVEAQYPRIIIDSSIEESLDLSENKFIKKDYDGKYYIDFFSILKVSNVYSPEREEKTAICKMRDSVYYLVEKYGHYDNRFKDREKIEESGKTILKYLWLLMKYNEYVSERKIPVHIRYQIGVNEKFLRFEIVEVKKDKWPIILN